MNKSKTIIGMICALAFTVMMGCVEEFQANFDEMPTEGLVVEGNIISDSTVVFQLSKTLPLTSSKENESIFNDYKNVMAEVAVMGSDGTSWPGVWQGSGRYSVAVGTLQPDVEYHLEIAYNGDIYRSRPQKPLATTGIENVSFIQPDPEGPVSILLDTSKSPDGKKKFYMWYFEEDWEIRAEYASTNLYEPDNGGIVTYKYPPVAQGWGYYGTDQIMLGATESNVENRIVGKTIQKINYTDHRLSVLYSIRIEQRDLRQEEYEYYQERLKQNNEMGGLFTPQPSELPTNITCSDRSRKVIGYVACNMGVSRHQLYLSPREVNFLNDFNCKTGDEPDGSYLEKYAAGFQICEMLETSMSMEVIWARRECVDVRARGADPDGRPSWWPNDYLYNKE